VDFHELILMQHARTHCAAVGHPDISVQDAVLNGVSSTQMRLRPAPALNSLSWVFWHITRAEDFGINFFLDECPQVLEIGGWIEKLGVEARYIGTRMTSADVDIFNMEIDIEALLAYRQAVGRQTRQFLDSLQPAGLVEPIDSTLLERARQAGAFIPGDEVLPSRWLGKNKAYVLTHTVLGHSLLHLGEGFVLRGLLGLPNV
jgi:hypothetical protein